MRSLACLPLVVLLAAPGVVSAQTAALGDLATRLAVGDQVSVLDRSGKTASGRLDKVSAEEIVVRAEDNVIAVPASDVRRVSVPRHGKRNGFLIGAGVGAFMGVVATRFGVEGSTGQAAMVLVSCGLYGTIGLGLGALWPTERVVYRAPDVAAASVTSGVRRVTARSVGVRVTLRW